MRNTPVMLVAGFALAAAVAWAAFGPAWAGPAAATRPAGGAHVSEAGMVKVSVYTKQGKLVPVQSAKVVKTDEEWKKQLTPEQYQIARGKGTERAFCGNLLDNKKTGVYACICCGLPLFRSDSKFDSGTGWPSFFQPIAAGNVTEHDDTSYGMRRTESLCGRCDAHLGHVFKDGPKPTGLRFCMNSESLRFVDEEQLKTLADPAAEAAAPATQPASRTAGS